MAYSARTTLTREPQGLARPLPPGPGYQAADRLSDQSRSQRLPDHPDRVEDAVGVKMRSDCQSSTTDIFTVCECPADRDPRQENHGWQWLGRQLSDRFQIDEEGNEQTIGPVDRRAFLRVRDPVRIGGKPR